MSQNQKGKTNLDLLEQEIVSDSGISPTGVNNLSGDVVIDDNVADLVQELTERMKR